MRWQTPRGTRDLLPEQTRVRNRLNAKFREVFERYGYGKVVTPAFEDFALLAKKSGKEIEKEIYAFKDKSGRKLGLRFDPTVPICRIVASNTALQKPIKYYYITRMWRYDRPGPGRYREFWQAGCELIGPATPEADAEMLAMVSDLLKAAGVDDFVIRVSSRRVTEAILQNSGIAPKKKVEVFRVLDKLGKIGEDGVYGELKKLKIADKTIEKLFVNLKATRGDEFDELSAAVDMAKKLGVKNIEFDFSIVRGIEYYTGFVFETFIRGKESLGSVASGGRYDTLVKIYGGEDLPAVGFGLGIDRLLDVLGEERDVRPETKVLVIPLNALDYAIEVTKKLRDRGVNVELDLMRRDLRKNLDYANKKSIPYVVILGEREKSAKAITFKDLTTGLQETKTFEELESKLKTL